MLNMYASGLWAGRHSAGRVPSNCCSFVISDGCTLTIRFSCRESNLELDCHKALQALSKSNRVTLKWIRGHNGNRGNDAADELARLAASLRVAGPERIIPIPFTEYKTWLHKQTQASHSVLWSKTKECKHTKEAVPVLNLRLTTKLLQLNRSKLRTVVGMITGNCPLNKHLSILGITDSPLCRACMETEETPLHVMLQCNGVAEQRAAHLGSSATLHEALGDLGGLLSFWSELGWLE
ncbi:jg24443 [Pararge aegeria aegeria]|uniref:Jg24443 protein n=1 Tax=Pararge aegeria aegeria TaxID=348720 RepID=A0A8S4RK94_9NEOP|nr:jg24443 [Pararge aegeria aegeria]